MSVTAPRFAGLSLLLATLVSAVASAQNGLGPAFESPPRRPPAAPGGAACSSCDVPRPLLELELGTGELVLPVTDLEIPAPYGPAMRWARTYRSRHAGASAQGHGWTHGYDVFVEERGADVLVHDGSGRVDRYRPDAAGRYVCPEMFREGSLAGGGVFTLLFEDGGRWVFLPLDGSKSAGRLARIEDRNGNALTLRYDSNGGLLSVTDPLGRSLSVEYDREGRIAAVSDFSGRRVRFEYYQDGDSGGSDGDLRSVTSPAVVGTPNGNDFPAGKTTTYVYSHDSRHAVLDHDLVAVKMPSGEVPVQYAYGEDPSAPDFDRLVRVTVGDPVQGRTDFHYERLDPATAAQRNAESVVVSNDPIGDVAEWYLDRRGRLVGLRRLTGRALADLPTTLHDNRPTGRLRPKDPAAYESSWRYNLDSQLKEFVDADGSVRQCLYESDLDPKAAPRARGNRRETRELPGLGGGTFSELVRTWEYDDGFGGCCGSNFVTRAVDARGAVTLHTYDDHGNRLTSTYPVRGVEESFAYDSLGRMVSHTQPDNGCGVRRIDTFEYHGPNGGGGNGFVAREIVDSLGLALVTSYSYDGLGRANRITDPAGHDSLTTFNELDQVVRTQSPDLDGKGLRQVADRTYDEDDALVQMDRAWFDDTGAPIGDGRLTRRMSYDSLDRRTRVETEVQDGVFEIEEFVFDARGNLVLERSPAAVSGAQPDAVVHRSYDERGLVFEETDGYGGPDSCTTRFTYDEVGLLVRRVIDPDGPAPRIHRAVYDGFQRLVRETDAMGNVRRLEYDQGGNLLRELVLGELEDELGSADNVRLSEHRYEWDEMNRQISQRVQWFDPKTQAPLGAGEVVTRASYSGLGDLLAQTDDKGASQSFCFDSAGRLTQALDADGNQENLLWDRAGNLLSRTSLEKDPLTGNTQSFLTAWLYDALGRALQETDPAGGVTQIRYDSNQRPTRLIDARGNLETFQFDGRGRLQRSVRELKKGGGGGGGKIGEIGRSFEYDENGRRVAATDGNGNTTRWVFDARGRVRSVKSADGTQTDLEYDRCSDLVRRTDANGTVTDIQYDLLGRPILRSYAPGPGVSADTTFERIVHDGLSRMVIGADDDSEVVRHLDSRGLLLEEVQDGMSFLYQHDVHGDPVLTTYPSGRAIVRTYDVLGRLDKISEQKVVLADFDWAGPDRLTRRSLPTVRATSTRVYDTGRRVLSDVSSLASGAVLDSRAYLYDALGNLVQRDDRRSRARLETFQYDSARRLTNADYSDRSGPFDSRSFELDPVGNRIQTTGGPCPGTWTMDPTFPDPADRPMNQYTTTPCDDRRYDQNGNTVEIAESGRLQDLLFDVHDRPVRFETTAAGPVVVTYRYDVLGRRIEKTVTDRTTEVFRTYFDGTLPVEERAGDGSVRLTRIFGAGRDPLSMRTSSFEGWCFGDDMGSVRVLTDGAGAVVERYEYDEFGIPCVFDGTGAEIPKSAFGQTLLFQAGLYDFESQTYWLGARAYAPAAGRFLSRDPLGTFGDPHNLGNAQNFAACNPQSFGDPTGFSTQTISVGGGWPGPATMVVDWDDCNTFEKGKVKEILGRSYLSAGRASFDALSLAMYYIAGVELPMGRKPKTVRSQIDSVFSRSGPVSSDTLNFVFEDLGDIWEGFEEDDVEIECTTSSDSTCDSASAYVMDFGAFHGDIVLCPVWFSYSADQRAGVLLHEASHKYASTEDEFYYSGNMAVDLDGDVIPWSEIGQSELRDNADTYEKYYRNYYVSKIWYLSGSVLKNFATKLPPFFK